MGITNCGRLCNGSSVEQEAYITDSNLKDEIIETISNLEVKALVEEENKMVPCFSKHRVSLLKELPASKYFKNQEHEPITGGNFFIDSYFKPEKHNIFYVDPEIEISKKISESDKNYLKTLQFNCITDLYPRDSLKIPKNFHISVSAADFVEGIGNPNLISSLLFLYWVNPKFNVILSQLNFDTKSFEIRLLIQGQPKWIIIDSKIPMIVSTDQFSNQTFRVGFTKTSEVNFWIQLIEKAIAKVCKSYGNIIRKYTSELYPLLTEIPMIKIEHSNKNKNTIWSLLFKASKKNWVIFVELDGYKNTEDLNYKLTNEDLFMTIYIVKAFEISGKKYLELSAPFLKVDSNLKNLLRRQFDAENYDNEFHFPENKKNSNIIIFVSFDYFYKLFENTYFLKFETDYFYLYNRYLTIPHHTHMLRFKLSHKSKVTFTLHLEQNIFNYNNCEKEMCYSKFMATKYNEHNNTLEYIKSIVGISERHNLELDLDSGDYILLYKVFSDEPMNVVISSYSEVKPMYLNESQNITKYFEKLSLSLFNSILQKKHLTNQINNNYLLTFTTSTLDCDHGFKIIKIENKTSDEFINMYIRYSDILLISHDKVETKSKKTNVEKEGEKEGGDVNIVKTEKSRNSEANNESNELEAYFTIKPMESEFIIFEYCTNPEDASIVTRFSVDEVKNDCRSFITGSQITQQRRYLDNGLYYFDIKYRQSAYIYVVNETSSRYEVEMYFSQIKNIKIVKPEYSEHNIQENTVKTFINVEANKKNCVILKAIDIELSLFYSIDIQVKKCK